MKANELRIGNWINDNGYNSIIGVIDSHYHAIQISGSPRMIALETIEPIPLTEEWLLRFGFNSVLTKIEAEIPFSICNDFIYAKEWKCILIIGNKSKELKYVHELQNWYYLLTSKELTIS